MEGSFDVEEDSSQVAKLTVKVELQMEWLAQAAAEQPSGDGGRGSYFSSSSPFVLLILPLPPSSPPIHLRSTVVHKKLWYNHLALCLQSCLVYSNCNMGNMKKF